MNRIISRILIVLPWFLLFFLFQKYAINLPFKDDYRVFISFFKIYLSAPGIWEKLNTLFIPDNESTPLIMRLIAIGQYHLSGHINFRYILLACWVFLLMIHLLLLKVSEKNLWAMVAVGLLIMNPMHQEMLFRTDVATYQLATLSLSIFMLYVSKHYKDLSFPFKTLFFIAFLITPGGSINGMLANAMVVFIFFKNNNKKQFYVSSIIFFFQIVHLFVLKSDSKSIGLIENIIKYNWRLPIAYFMSLGGLFHIRSSDEFKLLSFLIGLTIFVFGARTFVLINPRKWDDKTMIFLFCTSSLAAVVLLRYNYWTPGYESVLESRYKVYGAISMAMVLIYIFQKNKSKIINSTLFGIVFLLFLVGYYKSDFLFKDQKLKQLTDAWNIGQNVFDLTFAHKIYTSPDAPELLKSRKAFDLMVENKKIDNILKNSQKLSFDNYKIEISDFDPIKNGDWSKLSIPLKRLTFSGNFKEYEVYIARFDLENNKSALFFLYGKPHSFIDKLQGKKPDLSQLVHENYFDAIAGIGNAKVTLFGLEHLP